MARPKGLPKTGGRVRGVPNKTTTDIGLACRTLVDDEAYRLEFAIRLKDGKLAPLLEKMVWAYAYGEPKKELALTGANGAPLLPGKVIFELHQ